MVSQNRFVSVHSVKLYFSIHPLKMLIQSDSLFLLNLLGAWTAALKALPLASSEVSAAIECYHHLLKLRLLNEKNSSVYERADWLVDKLGTKVHSYYWLDEYSGKDNFSRYWKDEWKSGLTSWRQALQIPDSDVVLDGNCAKVVSQKDREKVHTVLNPGSEFAICDCGWSMMGNLCKHVIKSTKIYRDRGLVASSTSLFEYNQTLMSILNCPPHDSVIRDHAVALAVCVQTQLNALFELENSVAASTTSGPREEQTAKDRRVSATESFENADKDLINECQLVSDNRDEVSGNNSHSVAEKNSAAVESISYNGLDAVMQSIDVPTRLLPSEELAIDEMTASNCAENETGNLLDRGNTSIDACSDYVTIHVANTDQVGDGAFQNSVAEKMMDIDPHLQVFPTASGSGVLNGLAEEESAFQVSGVLIDNKIINEVSEAHSSDPMVIDSVEVGNGVCYGTEKNQLIVHEYQGSSVENASLDQNDEALGSSRIGDVVENNGNKGMTIGKILADRDGCADVDGIFGMSNLESCNPDAKEVDANDENVSEMDLRPCSIFATNDSRENVCIDQFLDVAQAEEKISADIRDKIDDDDDGRALEQTTSNAQTSSDTGRVNPSAEKHSSAMDIEVSTGPVEEVQVFKTSSGLDRKDGVEVAIDISSVSNGTSSNTEEKPSNGHVVHNMTLSGCSALGQ